MENRFQGIILLGLMLTVNGIAMAGETNGTKTASLTGLDLLGETYGPSGSHCSLGFMGFGSPVIVTRVSVSLPDNWVTEADQLLSVNGRTIQHESDLHAALDSVGPNELVTITVLRDKGQIEVNTVCRAATPILRAREEALIGASEGRWDTCIRATYMEEISWGGSNSQSAGLRLWCHQARILRSHTEKNAPSPASISRLHAVLIYEYAKLLLDELQHVPNGLVELRSTLQLRVNQFGSIGQSLQYGEVSAGRILIDQ